MKNQPRTVWLICFGLSPLWLVAAGGVYLWVKSWPVVSEAIDIPRPGNNVQAQAAARSSSLDSYNCIWTRSLQQELVEKKPPPAPKPQVQSRTVDLELIGTAIEGDESCAFVRTKAGAVTVVRMGSVIESFLVAAVHPDRVCLSRDGVVTYISLPRSMREMIETSGAAQRTAQQKRIALAGSPEPAPRQAPQEQQVARISLSCSVGEFLDSIRLVPNTAAYGRQSGFRIDSVSPRSLVADCGLAAGDVIVSVDAGELVRITDMERLCSSLEDGRPHIWHIRRGNANLEVQVNHTKENPSEPA